MKKICVDKRPKKCLDCGFCKYIDDKTQRIGCMLNGKILGNIMDEIYPSDKTCPMQLIETENRKAIEKYIRELKKWIRNIIAIVMRQEKKSKNHEKKKIREQIITLEMIIKKMDAIKNNMYNKK